MKEIVPLVEEVVRSAGKRVLEIYESDFEVIRKSDGSALTAADLASNEILSAGLKQFGWPVLSEESKDNTDRQSAERVWVIDPIDGTNGFVDKTGDFSIQVGLVEDGQVIFGVVYMPVSNTYYYAQKGNGAYVKREGGEVEQLQVRSINSIQDAVVAASATHFDSPTKRMVERIGAAEFIHIGGVGIKIGLIVEQNADAYMTTATKMGEWDMCAPHIILEEAGGSLTGLHGEDIFYNKADPHNPFGLLAAANGLKQPLLNKIESLQ